MASKTHWEAVYGAKAPDAVSWYAPHLSRSLQYVKQTGLPVTTAVIDVGGGEATLVDDLLEAGYQNLTVLDISATALRVSQERLGPRAGRVHWLAADILTHSLPPQSYDLWHDRAVFHFLNAAEERRLYVDQVLRSLRPGGFAIVATFGPQGPQQCSGLPVSRYAPEELHRAFGERFSLADHGIELHTTPRGTQQQFVHCLLRLER